MAQSDPIREAILAAPPGDPRELALELTKKFSRLVTSAYVVQVRGSLARAVNVEQAKIKASTTLIDNLDVMGEVKNTLLTLFRDASIPLDDRLDVSKELRLWLKSEIDAAGIKDEATNSMFVIDSAWSMDEVPS